MIVCLDPGHGGRDPGATAHALRESDIALAYALETARELERRLIAPVLTRRTDVDLAPGKGWPDPGKGVDLDARCDIANAAQANAFVSFHCNAGRASANGCWVLHAKGSAHGAKLARYIFDELAKIPGLPDSDPEREVYSDASPAVGWTSRAAQLLASKPAGVDPAAWLTSNGLPREKWYRTIRVLRGTKMPAVLVELGFLTNADDALMLQRAETMLAVAIAVAEGLEAWWSGD